MPKFALGFTRRVPPGRLICHMMGFHSILIFMNIAIIAIVIIAIVTMQLTGKLLDRLYGPNLH